MKTYETKMATYPLFVYGTLKRGLNNHWYLDNQKLLGNGTVPGVIFNLGRFPGYVSTVEGNVVHGEVYQVSQSCLQHIDGLEAEGYMYRRVVKPAVMEDGKVIDCYIYEYIDPLKGWEQAILQNGKW